MFSSHAYMPHGTCYLWNPALLALQVASDAGIALAYFSIPLMLWCFVRKRRDVPFGNTLLMFGAFIIACGSTHLMGIWTIWHPAFWLDGALKGVTAVVSLATAGMLVPLLPKALALKSPDQLERLNAELTRELEERERALAESQRQYAASTEALPQLVWTADANGGIDYYNNRYLEYAGLTLEGAKGWGWDRIVHPDDLERCLAIWRNSVALGIAHEMECRLRRAADGTYRWHLCRGTPIRDAGGRVVKWFGTCTDVDELKNAAEATEDLAEQLTRLNAQLERDLRARRKAEAALRASDERFRQVEEHAPIGLALFALDGGFVRVNPAFCRLLGYTASELLARRVSDVTHADDLSKESGYVRQALQGEIESFALDKRLVHRDGRVVWCLSSTSLVYNRETGEALYFIEQVQDVSHFKAAQQEIEHARQTALAASETKSRFVATMSHEVRTPMNGIIGMSELLLLTDLNAEQAHYAKVVRDSSCALLRVLNDILDYSKMEAGKLDLEYADFDVASQVRAVVSLLGPQFVAKDVSLTSHVAPSVPASAKGDAGRIRQILMNLVGNALKFTNSGDSVSISVEFEAAGTGALRFTVKDTGIGIAPDVAERLFQPFSQADGSTTRKYGGTGLGLSICKQLVDLMRGTIGVQSATGSGTTFWFTIPFERGRAPRPFQAPAREMTERRALPVRPESLLLAEDNEINALLALRQFKQLGFDVTIVSNGREAVEAVAREHYDLVFMDMHMPEMDGFEATRRIRESERDSRERSTIVAMTADAQAEDRRACLAAGMDDYLSKPVTLDELRAAIDRWLPPAPEGREDVVPVGGSD